MATMDSRARALGEPLEEAHAVWATTEEKRAQLLRDSVDVLLDRARAIPCVSAIALCEGTRSSVQVTYACCQRSGVAVQNKVHMTKERNTLQKCIVEIVDRHVTRHFHSEACQKAIKAQLGVPLPEQRETGRRRSARGSRRSTKSTSVPCKVHEQLSKSKTNQTRCV